MTSNAPVKTTIIVRNMGDVLRKLLKQGPVNRFVDVDPGQGNVENVRILLGGAGVEQNDAIIGGQELRANELLSRQDARGSFGAKC